MTLLEWFIIISAVGVVLTCACLAGGRRPTPAQRSEMEDEARARLQFHRDRVGDGIRRARLLVGMTQEELASASGITTSHVVRIERGELAFTYPTIERITAVLEGANRPGGYVDPYDADRRLAERWRADTGGRN